jgi:rRNA biogenesis protein RRP5
MIRYGLSTSITKYAQFCGVCYTHLDILQRISVGMKILGQIISIQPLALIISLPNQLFAHVPITNISSEFNTVLEGLNEEEDVDEEEEPDREQDIDGHSRKPRIPDLHEIFREGQYVRTVVTAVHAPGSTDASVLAKSRDEVVKSGRRVELSLSPDQVNLGVQKSDLKPGFVRCDYLNVCCWKLTNG